MTYFKILFEMRANFVIAMRSVYVRCLIKEAGLLTKIKIHHARFNN